MKVVYVAGPYRGKGQWDIEQNIRRAEHVALGVWATGKAAAICVHAMCRFYEGALDDYEIWLKGDLEIMKRCDAVLLVDGWEDSSGTLVEIELANKLGIPVFKTFDDFSNWLRETT